MHPLGLSTPHEGNLDGVRNARLTNPKKSVLPAKKEPAKSTPYTAQDYEKIATEILAYLYPKYCPEHKIPLTKTISTRRYAVRCPKCSHQQSRFSYTPFHHLKLPTWMFGWAIHESIQRYPQVLSSREIQRRLKIAKNSALLLKRRLQLFATDQTPRIKELMQNELKEKFNGVMLPRVSENKNVNEVLQGRSVPQVDSMVLFSASQRANQGRKRHKHTGQTASIYMNDKLGGKQIGTLVHTLAIKSGPVIYDSISNNRGETLRPLLDEYIPKDVPVFSDEGYKWYFRINKNHRMVNHNRKSEDKRYKWARNRWCHNGVHNQVAEGNHRVLKWNFTAGYSYITPEYSQLYLNEYAFWKNVKYYGWNKLIRTDEENRKLLEQRKAIVNQVSEKENQPWSESKKRDTNIKKSPVASQTKRGDVRGRETRSERNRGQNNAVIEASEKALESARADRGKGAGESPVFRRNIGAEDRQGRRPCKMPEGGILGILRQDLCEILDSNQ